MASINEYLSEMAVGLASAFGGGFTGWFFTRRKNELDMTEQAVKIWREMSQELRNEINLRADELKALRDENSVMANELKDIQHENAELKAENSRLKKEVDGLRNRLTKFVKKYGGDS